MKPTRVADALNTAIQYIYNPEALADVSLDMLLDMADPDNSMELSDPSDPVVYTIESSALLASAAANHDWWCMTKTYPHLAMNMGDLYRHMSDKDYIDIFWQPAETSLLLLLNKEEIFKHAVPPNGYNVRRIGISRDTRIEVDGYSFTLQYPIEIRVLPSGGLQIVQLSEPASPVRVMETNNIEWVYVTREVEGKAYECVAITIPVMQYNIDSFTFPLTPGISFKQTLSYVNKFFTARVWMRRKNIWEELKITHSQIVTNPTDPTAMLMVNGQYLQVKIPDIYVRQGLVGGEIRVDIYSTAGVVDLDLTGHKSDAFGMSLRDLNGEMDPALTVPYERLTFKQLYSQIPITGGRNALSFAEVRNRVIDNAIGPRRTPISEKQLQETLENLGYSMDLSVDTVSGRVFHVSKELAASTVAGLTTPCGTTNAYVRTTFGDLIDHSSVYNNDQRITLGPKTLYIDDSNNYRVYDRTIDQMLALSPLERMEAINANRFFFSPFYYVLDSHSSIFESRPYDLDSPKITSKEFVNTNITLELDIGIGECTLQRHAEGYLLRVVTRSSDAVKALANDQIEVQLCYKSRTSDNWSRLHGELVGYWGEEKPERVYDFVIQSNMDIDKNHDLIVNNFSINTGQVVEQAMQLTNQLQVVFGVNRYTTPNYKPSDIDSVLLHGTDSSKGVTHERLNVVLGHHLATLWANGRPETGGERYVTHAVDVPARYPTTTYLKEPNGKFVTEVDGQGVTRIVVEHQAGDVVLDANGDPIIQFHVGDTVYDQDNKPILANPRSLVRRLELFLLDGRYALCDAPDIANYIDIVKRDLLKSILFDLETVQREKLELTKFYIYPRNNMGKVWVRYADNTRNQIPAELDFTFTLSVDEATRTDPVLTASITETIRTTLTELLKDHTISVSLILDTIRSKIKDNIIDIEMEAWGPKHDQKIYTLTNAKDQMTMGKLAYVTQEGKVSLRDDIRMSWGRLDEDLKK